MMIETIPIPTDRVQEEERFQVRVNELTAWPPQEFVCRFEHNDLMDRWMWEMDSTRMGTVVPRTKVTLDYDHKIWPYMMARFEDTAGTERRVSTDNLGDRVKLCVYPGPLGGSYLPEAGLSQEEEDRLLRRELFDPVG